MAPFSAVLLAGGRSTRMGCDKALLPLGDGRLLWQRQLAVLEQLGAAEILFSGPAREGLAANVRRVDDAVPGLGPLAGLAAALEVLATPHGVMLAVDLPEMTPGFLARLLARRRPGIGIVPRVSGRLEPLAAVYPVELLPLAREGLASGDRSLNTFVRAAEAAGRLLIADVPPADARRFVNWNTPADLPGGQSFQRPA